MPGDKLEDNEGGGEGGEQEEGGKLGQRFYSWKQPLPQGARGPPPPAGTPPPGVAASPGTSACPQRPGSSYKRHAAPSDPKWISFCKKRRG